MAENILRCAGCNIRYRVKSFDPQKKYACPKCKEALKPESSATAAPDAQSLSRTGELPQPVEDELAGLPIAHYQIARKLGQGGMGAVYQAENVNLKRTVARKILRPELAASNPQFAQRFIRDAQSQAALTHPNVVVIHHVGKEGDLHFIEMEFVEGGRAGDLLEEPTEIDRVIRRASLAPARASKQCLNEADLI